MSLVDITKVAERTITKCEHRQCRCIVLTQPQPAPKQHERREARRKQKSAERALVWLCSDLEYLVEKSVDTRVANYAVITGVQVGV